MLIKGHSGCDILLLDETTIRKTGRGPFAARLQRQIEKQMRFQLTSEFDRIRAGRIAYRERGDEFQADMEFVLAKDFVQFVTEADRMALDGFWELIASLIRSNLEASEDVDVSAQVAAKLDELAECDVSPALIGAVRARCDGAIVVPGGPCHGDLTMSNILFKGTRLYLIDFLDSFVESPLQDVVKLRQDTFYGWSLWLYESDFDATKVRIALRYLDSRLLAEFASHDWYGQYYEMFQLLNLMRILPYCKDPKIAGFLTVTLEQLLMKSQSVGSA